MARREEPSPRPWSRVRDLAIAAAVYVVTARLGLLFAIFSDGVSPLWPPSGVVLGMAVLGGRHLAVGVAVGALANRVLHDHELSAGAALIGLGAGLECWVAATLLRRVGFDRTMARVRDVLWLVVVGAGLPAVISAALGATSLWLSGQAAAAAWPDVAWTWWTGDVIGVIAFTPVVLGLAGARAAPWSRRRQLELLGAGVALLACCGAVFLTTPPPRLAAGMIVVGALPVLVIVWVALWFDQRQAAAAMMIVAIAAILGASYQRGAFAGLDRADRVWLLQLYLLLGSLTAFMVSSLTAERRRGHALLVEREEQLRRSSELTGVGGFSWHLDEKVPRWSPQLHALFQIPADEAPLTLEQGVGIMAADDRARYQEVLARVRANPERYRFDFAFTRRDGCQRHARAVVEPVFGPTGEVIRWDGAIQDATDEVEATRRALAAERALQQAQRLESLGLLAGGVAHDFNNLLTVSLLEAEAIRAQVTDRVVVESLDGIVAASRTASALCKQMLTFAGNASATLTPLDLSALVSETAALALRSPVRGRCELDVPPGLPPVRGDRVLLGQVVMNLLLNAAQALGETGKIRVRTAARAGSADELATAVGGGDLVGAPCVVLTVEDDGHGMTGDQLGNIFQPFFTTKPDGRGLGLAAVPGAVQQHGGAIAVASTVGVGTCFTLWFPVDGAPGV